MDTNIIIKPVRREENTKDVIRPILKTLPKITAITKNKIEPPKKAEGSHPGKLNCL
jgi:hypothetical protein